MTIIEKIRAEIERQEKQCPLDTYEGRHKLFILGGLKTFLSDLEKEEKPTNPVCESKFKVGDRIQFKGLGHNKYTIAKVEDNRYVDTSGNGMDMSYTDTNFELVKEQPVSEGFDGEFSKFSNDVDAEHPFPICVDEFKDFARHFYELGRQSKEQPVEFEKPITVFFGDLAAPIPPTMKNPIDRLRFMEHWHNRHSQVQPVCEGLEEEFRAYCGDFKDPETGEELPEDKCSMDMKQARKLARHFAQWGAEHLATPAKIIKG